MDLTIKKDLDDTKVAFITCVNSEEWYSECRLYLESLKIPAGMTAEFIPVRGAASMCAGYNSGMNQSDAKYKVYLHQDTLVVNKNLVADLRQLFVEENVGAVGVIGCRSLPRSGVWWDGLRTYGRVLHACEPESVVDSHCREPEGNCQEVEAVDGLFIATQYDIPWREDLFTGFHLYDTSLCKEMQRRGLKVVVPNQEKDFWCIHCPKEKPLAKEYKGYQKIFVKEYGGELNPEV
ncbi:glycosyltransferase family protein [Selenomonas sp. ND2010]|uniref:glycosyltransferase family protein n=1 Tax=Selenomonas sp. ND2010 TaxID=1410618 RepID=UPI000A728B36|nr:glycosyltransferase family protein [Selenomonas sp. ND2010]